MPYYRYSLNTPLNPDEVAERLTAKTVPAKTSKILQPKSKANTWRGKVDKHDFLLYPQSRLQTLFFPAVRGVIQGQPAGALIDVTMIINPLAPVLMVAIIGSFIYLNVAKMVWVLVPTMMIVVGIGFVIEVHRAKKLLAEQLQTH